MVVIERALYSVNSWISRCLKYIIWHDSFTHFILCLCSFFLSFFLFICSFFSLSFFLYICSLVSLFLYIRSLFFLSLVTYDYFFFHYKLFSFFLGVSKPLLMAISLFDPAGEINLIIIKVSPICLVSAYVIAPRTALVSSGRVVDESRDRWRRVDTPWLLVTFGH